MYPDTKAGTAKVLYSAGFPSTEYTNSCGQSLYAQLKCPLSSSYRISKVSCGEWSAAGPPHHLKMIQWCRGRAAAIAAPFGQPWLTHLPPVHLCQRLHWRWASGDYFRAAAWMLLPRDRWWSPPCRLLSFPTHSVGHPACCEYLAISP